MQFHRTGSGSWLTRSSPSSLARSHRRSEWQKFCIAAIERAPKCRPMRPSGRRRMPRRTTRCHGDGRAGRLQLLLLEGFFYRPLRMRRIEIEIRFASLLTVNWWDLLTVYDFVYLKAMEQPFKYTRVSVRSHSFQNVTLSLVDGETAIATLVFVA